MVSPRWLGAAPHRLMFFAGATNVMVAMVWWTVWLVASRWPQLLVMKYPPVYPGWLHAFVMQYQMLPAFYFGFLLTTFPKWTKQPEVPRSRFVPVGVALLAGQLTTLAGALFSHTLIVAGVGLTMIGWLVALTTLAPILWREDGRTWHAHSCIGALTAGLVGLILFEAFLLGGRGSFATASIVLGTFGLALMILFTVAHRMFPFFATNVVPGYVPWRPSSLLIAMWVGAMLHIVLSISDAFAWLWFPDAALCVTAAIACWRWWPRGKKPGLLAVLFYSLLWLPFAMLLYTVSDINYAARGAFLLGRAPAHALFIGFFGSALVAMVTRVTQGHSGRPLEMPRTAWFAFIGVQLIALVRVVGELTRDPFGWFAIAAIGWLLAFAPWTIRLARIYVTPRADGKPG